jgi:hypothetical protein
VSALRTVRPLLLPAITAGAGDQPAARDIDTPRMENSHLW